MIRRYKKGDNTLLYKNFRAYEFDCNAADCSETLIDDELVAILQKIRDHFERALSITSGYRCPHHNAEVGGGSNSYHMKGMAADIVVSNVSPREVARYAESIGVLGIGLYEDFVHVDTRTVKFFWYSHRQIPQETFGGSAAQANPQAFNPMT